MHKTFSKTRRDALSILKHALKETSIEKAMRENIKLKGNALKVKKRKYRLDKYEKIYVFGSGKASYGMASFLKSLLGDRIAGGLVIHTEKHRNLGRIRVVKGTHPLPSAQNLAATRKMVGMLEKAGANDLIIYLTSGGTSSLLCCPRTGLREYRVLNKRMIEAGMTVKEINTVRKKISRVKAGRLLSFIRGKAVNLVVSDVVGDPLDYVGSGPMVYSNPSSSRVLKILKKHKIPLSLKILKAIKEKEKRKKRKADSFVLLNNTMLLKKAAEKARKLGYKAMVKFPEYEGSPEALARKFSALPKLKRKTCLISGGELSTKVRGRGRGGPNQEFVLYCRKIPCTSASMDSDGIDGNSRAAGAVADERDFRGFEKNEVEKALKGSDSYTFLKKRNCLIVTGPTGTNLNDLRVLLKR